MEIKFFRQKIFDLVFNQFKGKPIIMEEIFQKGNFFLEWKRSGADVKRAVQKGMNAIDFERLAGGAKKTSTKYN